MRIIEAPQVVEPAVDSVVLDRNGLAWQRHPGDDNYPSVWIPAKPGAGGMFTTVTYTFANLLIERGPLRVIWDAADEQAEIDARPSDAELFERAERF